MYSALYGIFTIITYYSGFRAGFCFSAGATDLVFSASLPAAAKTWMIIPLGIAAFVVFYAVFYFAITKFDLKTPGREDEDEEAEKKVVLANNNYTEVASAVLAAVGGKENVKEVGYCATRLRFEVNTCHFQSTRGNNTLHFAKTTLEFFVRFLQCDFCFRP